MTHIQKIIFCFIALIIVLAGAYYFYNSQKYSSLDRFAMCLTESEVKMLGVDYCPSCQNQKKIFGSSFEYIDYINCDFNKESCQELGIKFYPSWEINGKIYPGVKSIVDLKNLSGCSLH